MKNLITALCFLTALNAFAGNKIAFEDSEWEMVIEKAKQTNKPIFLEGFADYCMPCRMMDEMVFTDSDLSLFFNEHFISYKVDVQTEEGKLLQFLYDIKALPDLLFVDPSGNVIVRNNGSAGVNEVLSMGSTALYLFENKSYENYTPQQSEEIFVAVQEPQSEQAVRERSEQKTTSNAGLASGPISSNPVLDNLVRDLPNRLNESNVSTLVRDIELYRARGTKEEVDQQLTIGFKNAAVQSVSERDYRGVQRTMRLMKKIDLTDQKNLSFQMEALYCMATGNWVKYSRKVDRKFKRNYYVSINLMERAANAILANTEKRVAVRKAKKWLKQVKEYSPVAEIESCEYLMDYALIY